MKKMFVSSFYNTILNSEEAIPMSTMLSIDNMKKKGVGLTILTNRKVEDVLYYNNDYPFIDYIVAYNGSIVYDVEKKTIIKCYPISNIMVNKITNNFKKEKLLFYTEKNTYDKKPNEAVYKIEIPNCKKSREKLNELDIPFTIFKFNKVEYIEITGRDPHRTLQELTSILEISMDDVSGVVGNLSEKELVEKLNTFYVVSNSPKELKLLTTNKVKSNDSKGVEQAINKIYK